MLILFYLQQMYKYFSLANHQKEISKYLLDKQVQTQYLKRSTDTLSENINFQKVPFEFRMSPLFRNYNKIYVFKQCQCNFVMEKNCKLQKLSISLLSTSHVVLGASRIIGFWNCSSAWE